MQVICVWSSWCHFHPAICCSSKIQVVLNKRPLNGCTLCLKNIPPLTCYNLDIHDPITIIFGRSVTKKVRNWTMLCFPSSPVYWFFITLWNTKPRNGVFSLKHCILFCQQTHKIHSNYHLVAVELPFIPKVIDCMHQTIKTYLEGEHSIWLSVTRTLYVYQFCHCVSRCVKDGSCSSSSLVWKLMNSINGISYYLNKCQTLSNTSQMTFFLSRR